MTDARPCVLLIDDDEGFCRLVQKHLERRNFSVIYETSSADGLRHVHSGRASVVVLDHVMPGEDGLVALSLIQSLAGAPPVIYLTGHQDSRVAVAALKAGAVDYVVKDLQGEFLDLLESAVTSALASAEIRRARDAAEAEVRQARDQFKALADERALLLREVNHRVSNSLQLIASFLHFQADISDSRAVKDALKEANSRVMAVARVHRWLYVSDNVRAVSLGDYLHTLIDDLEGVTGAPLRAPIAIQTEQVEVDPDKAVAVGIIATELILNAFKHAYPDGTGPVRVSLTRNSGTRAALVVEDDGVGAMNGVSRGFSPKPGLGQRIVRGMAEKLEGELLYDPTKQGTRAILVFPAFCPGVEKRADATAAL